MLELVADRYNLSPWGVSLLCKGGFSLKAALARQAKANLHHPWQQIMALADFRYVMRFRVPFCDIDMLQHVNHAAYIVWAETARGGYLADVLGEPEGGRNGVILARLEFDYERPLDYREDVAVGCRIARLGRKSFDFVHEIWSETRGDRAARGLCAMVTYDHEAKASKVVPERWREAIIAYETVAPVLTTGVPS